jgi:hypothetical protein
MNDDVLFTAGDLAITRKVACFGRTVYQVAGISGVAVENSLRMNTLALLVIFFGIGFSWPAFWQAFLFLVRAFGLEQPSRFTPLVWHSASREW